jgi:glycosyltransferase involved in cell wall biosynthesis
MKILYHHRIRSKDGQYVHISEMVAALGRQGHDVIMVGPSGFGAAAFGGGGGGWIKRLPKAIYEALEFAYNILAFARLAHAWWRHRPDAVYERYNLFLLAGAWFKHLSGLPFVVEVNAPLSEERARHDGGLALGPLARWGEGVTWRSADCVVTVTGVLAQYVRAAGVPDRRIAVLPNGIDPERYRDLPDATEAKRGLGIGPGVVLGFTGFVRTWHGLDRVIHWMASAPAARSARLVVVGDGPAIPELKAQARMLNVSDRVDFAGLVTPEKVAHYAAAFDIALQPAVTAYASPLKIIEYMAAGCAIVAPNMPNIRELLDDGETALLFDTENPKALAGAIEKLIGDGDERRRLGRAAREAMTRRRLTWDGNAERTVELLRGKRAPAAADARPAKPQNRQAAP